MIAKVHPFSVHSANRHGSTSKDPKEVEPRLFFIRRLLPIVCVLLIFCACTNKKEDNTLASDKAPRFALEDLKGRTVRLEDLKGKVVLVNFFATWCFPCRVETPMLVQLHRRFQHKGLEIVGISLDMEGAAVLNPFVQHYGITYPVVIGTRQVVQDYGGIRGIPTSFLIDREGRLAEKFVSVPKPQELEASVLELLGRRG